MKVAVFGAGTMGSGIAQVFAAHGHTTLMYASSVASAQRHKDKLDASLQKRVEKGKMNSGGQGCPDGEYLRGGEVRRRRCRPRH